MSRIVNGMADKIMSSWGLQEKKFDKIIKLMLGKNETLELVQPNKK